MTRAAAWRVPLSVALLALAVVLLALLRERPPREQPWLPRCPSHTLTGLHCPGCGSTRATYALLHGNLAGAVRQNALLAAVLPLLGIALARCWWRWVRGGPFRDALVERWSLRLAPAMLIAVILFTILRNTPAGAWLAPMP